MSAAWMRARSELRSRIWASVALALLIGLAGGIVLTALAGASRTDSAYRRYLQATRAADFLISTGVSGRNVFYRELARLPQVEAAGVIAGEPLGGFDPSTHRPDPFIQTTASEEGKAGYTVDRPRLLAGRMPDPSRPLEALANRTMALKYHLHVGSTFPMYRFDTNADFTRAYIRSVQRQKPELFTITGVGVFYDEVVRIAPLDGHPSLLLTPAYYRTHSRGRALNFDGEVFRLRPGTDVARLRDRVDRLAAAAPGRNHGLFVADLDQHAARVERAVHPQALALEIFAVLAAMGAVLAIGQMLSREVHLASVEHSALRALGLTRGQLVGVSVLRLAAPVVTGAILAVVGAILASPLMPIGAARIAEPDPGVSVNPAVLGLGLLAILVVALAIVVSTAWRAATTIGSLLARRAGETTHPSRVAESAARTGLAPSAVTGVRMALEPGRGRTAIPVRSAVVGLVVAVTAVTAVFTFGTNLNRLVSTPRLYGDTWNLEIDGQFAAFPRPAVMKALGSDRNLAGIAGGDYGDNVTIDGQIVPTVGIDSLMGRDVFPPIVRGHRPEGPGQIALGAKTLRLLSVDLGDRVTLRAPQRPARSLRVVGQVVLPAFGRGSFTPTDLGEGAVTAADLVPQRYQPPHSYNFVLIRYGAGVDAAAETARIEHIVINEGHCVPGFQCVFPLHPLPTDVRSYAKVRATPLVLAVVLALLAATMIGHALVTTVRRRRRDLAVLKTLGFVKGQVALTVGWEASTFAIIGLVLGVPLGIAAGRWLWALFADQVGIPPSVAVPLAAALILPPATLLLANLIAALPGRAAAKTQPAVVLRTE